ncbi:MAG TPA: PAS domain S-box protein, partial [Spirochaetota bacterium]|nr:PAS domain S-box protein [Spirochaetota bacterium]
MEQIDYRKILAESSSGYAYYRLILDDNGTLADYQFIEVNKAFERLTGTDSVNIVGRRITEIIRDEKHEVYDLIKQYGEIVLSGQSREFEQYSRHLNRWYRVEVTPQDDLSFVTIYSDITELKQSTSKLMQYMEYAPDGIFIADNRGKFVSVNPAGCRILGFGEDELRNMSITDFVTPESRESSIDGIRTILVSGSDKRELLLKRNGGDRIWVSLKTERLPDGTFMGFCRDITDRKAAEAGLKQYAMFNKTLIETIPLPVYYKDLDGNYIGLNKAMEVLYGKTRDEFEGKSVSDVSPAPAAERYKKHDYELLKNPGVLMFEDQWIDYYGETRDVIFHKATFNNLDGSVGGIIGAIVDITDFKKTHRELELYFKAIQAVAQPVLLTDSKGNIIRVNNAFINMYGFTFDEL